MERAEPSIMRMAASTDSALRSCILLWAISRTWADVMLPMLVSGALLGLSRHNWYPVYGICGRFAPISPLTDQHLGGLIIWLPGSVFLVAVALFILRRILRQEDTRQAAGLARAPHAE